MAAERLSAFFKLRKFCSVAILNVLIGMCAGNSCLIEIGFIKMYGVGFLFYFF